MDDGVPPQLHPQLAALLPGLPTAPAREVGLDAARARFSELLTAGLAGGPDADAEDVDLG